LPSAPPRSVESSLSASASNWSWHISSNGGESSIPARSVLCGSAVGWNLVVQRRMGGLPGVSAICLYGVVLEHVSQLSGMFSTGVAGSRGTPGNDGLCPMNCWEGNIWGPPYPL
jgi:hypothetical protein